ncbi:hypothetical protein A2U01_0085642, partial [Trifolium medium]|nr:hypothetical protein [Trifolium medium]
AEEERLATSILIKISIKASSRIKDIVIKEASRSKAASPINKASPTNKITLIKVGGRGRYRR